MSTHKLKTIQPYFDEVVKGFKTFEVRKNDRDFKTGDIVILKEYDMKTKEYSGMEVWGHITYILDDEKYVKKGQIVFSFYKATNGYPPKEGN